MAANLSNEKNWVQEVHKSLKNVISTAEQEKWRKHSTYHVPAYIKDLNSKAYQPQVVSFGPFHHGEKELAPMEDHKHRALLHFLKRAKRPLEDFVSAIEEVLVQLQDSYQNLDEQWIQDKERFVQLMIIDGCFMLELMSKETGIVIVKSQPRPSICSPDDDYAPNDPIFSPHGMLYTMPYIKRDMLLLENQLPLLVLETLWVTADNITVKSAKYEHFVNRLVVRTIDPQAHALPPGVGLGFHVLDIYRKSFLFGIPSPPPPTRPRSSTSEIIRPAMELYEAGIRFNPSGTTSLHDISFHDGMLTLPTIAVDDITEDMLLNLMAFERLHMDAGHEITSYVLFLDNMIHSAKDVGLLSSKGVIFNKLGTDEEVARIFRNISKDIVLPKPMKSLIDVQKSVNWYCSRPWNKGNYWRANLSHSLFQTYFRSPWAILTLLAAIFFLIMTVMQTVYTALQYYENNSPKKA